MVSLPEWCAHLLCGSQPVKKFPHITEPKGSLRHSQMPTTSRYPEIPQSSPYPHIRLSQDPIYAWVSQVVSFSQVSTLKT